MLRNYYISKEWMVSRRARSIYRAAASLSVGSFVTLVIVFAVTDVPGTVLPIIKLLIFLFAVGAATTSVAMEYFLFGFDTSSWLKKVFWFCVMLIPWPGAPLYCWFVYSRSNLFKVDSPNPQHAACAEVTIR